VSLVRIQSVPLIFKINTMATAAKRSRQSRVLVMLEKQLKSGVKTQKKTTDVKVPLTETDIKRIKKEIEILTKLV